MGFHAGSPLEAEQKRLFLQEERLLAAREKQEESALNRMLAEKIPKKLRGTLDDAFRKAFAAVFEKGSGLIEKTMQKKNLEDRYKILAYTDTLKQNRKSLRAFSGEAKKAGRSNLLIGGGAGIGMGFLGIGLPDIPLFTGMTVRALYEIAISYGYACDTPEEQNLMLLLIWAAAAPGRDIRARNAAVDRYLTAFSLPEYCDGSHLTAWASAALSGELLYMKFLQGIPVIGTVGGAYDAVYLRRITRYAELKYRRRFLSDRKKREECGKTP